jgi:CubicO group peptidase (beta-lactamase class C family)
MSVEINGFVADGFEKVADQFEQNFAEHGEVGAACAVRVRGELVVDLWGGVADPKTGRPYEADTLQLVFSSTKGMVALAAHQLAEQGRLDLDAPVTDYWPEFGANGKAAIPVRWILGHRSGVVGLERVLSKDEFCDWATVIAAIEEAAPVWEPGTAHGYHALTFGHLVGEIVRRVTGEDIGAYVRDHIATPVGAEFAIGVTDEQLGRVAPLLDFPSLDLGDGIDPTFMAILTPGSPTNRAFMIAPVMPVVFNEEQLLRAQIPSGNGCTSARSLAAIYGATVSEVEGTRLVGPEQVEVMRRTHSSGDDLVLVGDPNHVGCGFFLPDGISQQLGEGSFGHGGLGGSYGAALPEREVGFGYVMNQCLPAVKGDPRCNGLMAAVTACTA